MNTLSEAIYTAQRANRVALVPFITAGFPDTVTFWEVLDELDMNGADIIEIGVPFSDPVADGPVVEAASRRALEQGVTLAWILEGLAKRITEKGRFRAQLVLMGYYNPFLQYGLEHLAKACLDVGVSGLIVPDVPLEESEPLRSVLKKNGISLIALVGQNTTQERMNEYAKVAEGYVYVVSVLGTTGSRTALPDAVIDTLCRAKNAFTIPVALGFGLHNPEQLEYMPKDALPDAVVFGSALLNHIDQGFTVKEFLQRWSA